MAHTEQTLDVEHAVTVAGYFYINNTLHYIKI